MYVKHKETGEYFCFNEALMDTGSFVKVDALPKAEVPVVEAPVVEAPVVEAPVVEAPVVEAPVVEAPKAPVNKPRAPKGK